MRTTLNLDDELVMEAKIIAVRTRRTLSAVIEDGLRRELARVAASGAFSEAGAMPVSSARGGLQPGVDLSDNAALREIMEADSDAAPGRESTGLRVSA